MKMMMMKLFALVLVLASFAVYAKAQTSSAAVTGHVVDNTQAVIPNAEVRLTDELTNVTVTTHTNASGDFIFPNTQPGTYAITIEAPGFKELRKVDLRLSASQNLSAGNMTMAVGAPSQTVTVQADITPLQNTSSERSGVLDTEQLDNLLAIGRDPMAMTRVLPGVVGNEGTTSLSQSATPTVNGVNSEYNMASIDGVVGNTRGFGTLDTPPNLDSIQEVEITQSVYQAQYGKTAGSEINFVTKSGTSHFHGGGYEYFRNEDLNANAYFNKYGTYIPRPQYRYNTLGGTIGGPVIIPKIGISSSSSSRLNILRSKLPTG